MSDISDRIHELIQRENISYRELEKATGINYATLQRYATGATNKMPLEAVEKISRALHVEPAYIMGWNEESRQDDLFRKKKILIDKVTDATSEELDKLIRIADIIMDK